MLAKYLKLFTFAKNEILKLDYFASQVIRILLDLIANLKEAIVYNEIEPQFIVA
jgi:hypothetical protein